MEPSDLNLLSEDELNYYFREPQMRELQKTFNQTPQISDGTNPYSLSRQNREIQSMSPASLDNNANTQAVYHGHASGPAQDRQLYTTPHPPVQDEYGYNVPTSSGRVATSSSQTPMLFLSNPEPQVSGPSPYQRRGIMPSIPQDHHRNLGSGMQALVYPYPENGYLELSPSAGPETDPPHQLAPTADYAYDLSHSSSAEVSENVDALQATGGVASTLYHLGHNFSSSSSPNSVSDHRPSSPPSHANDRSLGDANIKSSKYLVWDSKTGQEVEETERRRRATAEERAGIQLMRFLRACDNCRKTKTKCDPSHHNFDRYSSDQAVPSTQEAETNSLDWNVLYDSPSPLSRQKIPHQIYPSSFLAASTANSVSQPLETYDIVEEHKGHRRRNKISLDEQLSNAAESHRKTPGRNFVSHAVRESTTSWVALEESMRDTQEMSDFGSQRCLTYSAKGRSEVESCDTGDDCNASVASRMEAGGDLSIRSRVASPQIWDNVYVGTQFSMDADMRPPVCILEHGMSADAVSTNEISAQKTSNCLSAKRQSSQYLAIKAPVNLFDIARAKISFTT